ncbi:MAG: LysM domain-containing protein [Caldilineales bacterium]
MKQQRVLRFLAIALVLVMAISLVPSGAAPMAAQGDLLVNGDFEHGFTANCGGMVGSGWGCFTNGGAAAYGFYDDMWARSVFAGAHSQLIEINTKQQGGDANRNAGIFQTVTTVAGSTYELSLKGMIRAEDQGGDPWRYRVYVGFDYSGAANWQAVSDWRELPWDTYYSRTNPGAFSGYSTQVTASGGKLTVFVRTERRWATWYEETDFNLDSISLSGMMPAPVPTAVPAKPAASGSGYTAPPAQPGDSSAAAPAAGYTAPPAQPGDSSAAAPAAGYTAPPAQPGDSSAAAPAASTLATMCSGPNLVINGGFENGFTAAGVGLYWSHFTNGGKANYGIYDDQWASVVAEGRHSQLLEINSKGLPVTDADRINGIMQRLSLRAGATYEISFSAAMREAPTAADEDFYRYMVEWGYSVSGTANPAQMLFHERVPLSTIYNRVNPGAAPMQRYSTRFVAPAGGNTTIAIWALKKWATLERELDVNIDNVAVRACGPAPVVTPPVVKPPVVKPPVVKPPQPKPDTKTATCVIVQRGDTLSSLAMTYHSSVAAIMQANNLVNANMIFIGQTLCFPGGHHADAVTMTPPPPAPPAAPVVSKPPVNDAGSRGYRVQRGDTLSGIAASCGVPLATLMQINAITDPNFIYAGQWIRFP